MDYLSEVIKAAVWGEQLPQMPKWNKWLHRNLSDSHCEECLKLDGCWFTKDKTPEWPHHPYCHCVLKGISYNEVVNNATATAAYSKFDPYLFDINDLYKHGKSQMLESWGYSVKDSEYLKAETEKQGLQKYLSGEYRLGVLNKYGQRISIRIEIPNKKQEGTVSFVTGWTVHPNGKITLNTPYGGK